MADNIINAVFGSGICAVTTSAFRANYGMVLRFSGIDLPTAFECDFSNYDTSNNDSITAIGQDNEVQIPDDLWDSGLNIYAYVYLHPTDNSGVTVYTVTIPVLGRPNRTEETPTPHEQSVIEQAISALNDAVEQTAADVETTTANAQAAAQSEANALSYANQASASAGAALASQNAAHASETASAQSAQSASGSADQASQSAQASAESADTAQGAAASAERSATDALASAATAQSKATEAASSAATASGKANEASASATAAAQSASSAASSATAAESSATDAEQAKTDAQAAQAAAEQAAQSVSGLSAQIEQNTADIADLVLSKAGALIDTATGSIASFYPDSTIQTVRGLTVDIEPVQDLHGYDAPWPSGGGKNLWGDIVMANDMARTVGAIVNTTDKTVSITTGAEANMTDGVVFKENTQYTFIFDGVVSQYGNLMFSYTDGTNDRSLGRFFSVGANVSAPNKTVAGLYKRSYSNTTLIYYEKAGLFEGNLTASQFSPYSNICPISGWDAVEVQRTGVNVLNPSADAFVQTWSYLWQKDVVPNGAVANMSFTDKDTSVDATGCYFGFVADDLSTTSISPNDFRWVLLNGAISSNKSNVSSQSQKLCRGVFIYPKTVATLNKIFSRWDVQVELGSTATAYTPYQGDTYQIQLGQTVYGGTVDVTNGVLTVDRAMVDLGTLTWAFNNQSANIFRCAPMNISRVVEPPYTNRQTGAVCSNYPVSSTFVISSYMEDKSWLRTGVEFFIRDTSYTDVTAFKAAMSGVQLCYELATPITIPLSPIEISVLTGQTNNVLADCGDVSVEYAADLKTYIDQKIAAAVAALS